MAKNKGTVKITDIDKIIDRTKQALTYFEDITIENLIFKDNKYSLYFMDDILYITNNDYEIVLTFERQDTKIKANIPLFYVKKHNISLVGDIEYDILNNNINIDGEFNAYNIDGNFSAFKVSNRIDINLNSKQTDSIEDIVKSFNLKDKINDWIIKKVKAKTYNIEKFNIGGDIIDGKFKIDLDSIYAKIHGKNLVMNFRKGASTIVGKSLDVIFEKGNLIFNIQNPKYRNKNISKSKIVIKNLANKNDPILDIKLLVNSMFDDDIHEILKAYKINIPITQTTGKTKALVDININLKNKKVKFIGDFNLKKAKIYIGKSPLFIEKGTIKYDNFTVYIKNTKIKDKWYNSLVNGKVDVKSKKANLNLNIKKLNINSSGTKMIYAENIKTPLLIDYSKPNILFNIPKTKSKFYSTKEKFYYEL